MKKTNYKGKAEKELLKALFEKRESLRTLNFNITGSKTRNVGEGSSLKKDIARIMTELNS